MEKEKKIALLSMIISVAIPLVLTLLFIACKENKTENTGEIQDKTSVISKTPDISESGNFKLDQFMKMKSL